jgi:hypothetical protein
LWRAFVYRPDQPVLHHTGREERPDQLQHAPVADPCGNPRHQLVVADPVEEFLQIQVHHPAVAFGHIVLCPRHRLMRRASGSKPVAVIGKRPVPASLQNLKYRLLDKAIPHRRHPKLPDPATVRLVDLDSLDRLRSVGPAQQLFPNRWPVLLQIVR